MSNDFFDFMPCAFSEAQVAFAKNEVPVGAVIVDLSTYKVIASASNASLQNFICHAEILAINQATDILQTPYLSNCAIYVTLEPCAMCAAAISLARLKRLYYGTVDTKFGAVESASQFFTQKNCFHKPEIYTGFMESEIKILMQSFFKALRA